MHMVNFEQIKMFLVIDSLATKSPFYKLKVKI